EAHSCTKIKPGQEKFRRLYGSYRLYRRYPGLPRRTKLSSDPRSSPVTYSPRMSRRVGAASTLSICACVARLFQFQVHPSLAESLTEKSVQSVPGDVSKR